MAAARALAWLALLCGAAPRASSSPLAPQEPSSAQRLLAELATEGPLDNDTFLTTRAEAEEALEEGDAWIADRAAPSDEDLALAFESWRRALAESEAGDMVSAGSAELWPDVDGTAERRATGVAAAVHLRLRRLGPSARKLWRERFEELGDIELAAAGSDPQLLAQVEWRNPLTSAAARAGLALTDLALAEGRRVAAGSWLERAERHAQAGDLGPPFGPETFARRRDVLAALSTELPAAPAFDWRGVAGMELVNILLFEDGGVEGPTVLPAADRGVRPGAVDLGDGRAALQTASQVHLIELDTGVVQGVFEPAKLAPGIASGEVVAPRGAPGWPLLPAWDGEALVLVQGTGTPARGNAVVAVSPPEPGDVLPRLRWAVREQSVFDADGVATLHPLLDELGIYEFQPGPVVVGQVVVVQVWQRLRDQIGLFGDARFTSGGEVRAWLVGLDLQTGEPRFATWLAKGVARGRSGGGFLQARDRISNGQPLGVAGGRAIVPTQLGVVASVDPADGRVDWALRTRRRDAETRSWAAARPLLDGDLVHVAPADSDRLYWLRAGLDGADEGLLAHPPAAIAQPRCLAGVVGNRSVVLLRSGIRPALALVDPASGNVQEALHLAPEESLAGPPARSGEALVLSTDRGVYVFDCERELYLCASAGLLPDTVVSGPRRPRGRSEAGLGGTVHVIGDRILVTGPHLPAAAGRPTSIAWVFGPSPR